MSQLQTNITSAFKLSQIHRHRGQQRITYINEFALTFVTAAYKSQSNSAAENAVKTFKTGMQKAPTYSKIKNNSVETIMNRFLFYYRSSVHSTTLETPYKLMFGHEMITHFDRIKPNRLIEMCEQAATSSTENSNSKPNRIFAIDDRIWVHR